MLRLTEGGERRQALRRASARMPSGFAVVLSPEQRLDDHDQDAEDAEHELRKIGCSQLWNHCPLTCVCKEALYRAAGLTCARYELRERLKQRLHRTDRWRRVQSSGATPMTSAASAAGHSALLAGTQVGQGVS